MTILLTGGIGSGKSSVRRILEGMGVPCYDADSAVKGFYGVPLKSGSEHLASGTTEKPFLLPEIEAALGLSFRKIDGSFDSRKLADAIFSDSGRLKIVESIVFPALAIDFARWRKTVGQTVPGAVFSAVDRPAGATPLADLAIFESATALDKPDFPKLWDKCIWADAPEDLRVERVIARDHCSREQVLSRIRLQSPLEAHRSEVDAVILNDCSLQDLPMRVRSALSSTIPMGLNECSIN